MKPKTHASTRLARAFTLATVFSSLSSGALFAQTNGTWSAAAGGDWSNSANWSGAAVASGTDAIATFSAAGTQPVNLDSNRTLGSLAFSTGTYTISSNNGSVLTLATSTTTAPAITGNATISAGIAGSQGFTFASGNRTLRLSGANSYTGVTTLTNGNLTISSNSGLGASGVGNHTVVSQASGQYPQLHLANITTGEDFTLSMNWYNVANNGSVVGGNLLFNDSGTTTLNGTVTVNRAAGSNSNVVHVMGVQGSAGTLALAGAVSGSATGGQASGTYADPTRLQFRATVANANVNVSGTISDGTLTAGGLSVYTQDNSVGTVRLSGANTYTGTTAHKKGNLLINNATGSGTGFGSVSVATTAVLGGTGIIAPAGTTTVNSVTTDNGVTISSGGIVAPGDLTTAGAAISEGENLAFDLSGTAGKVTFESGALIALDFTVGTSTVNESLAFTGLNTGFADVVFNNNKVNFSIVGTLANGLYTLATFDANGAYSGLLDFGTGLEDYDTKAFVYNANSIQLQIGAIPEPASFAAVGGAIALGFAATGRRRRK